MVLLAGCAQHTDKSSADMGVDPAVAAAIAAEGPVRFAESTSMEQSLGANLMAEIIKSLGGEAEVVPGTNATLITAIADSDDMAMTEIWPWQVPEAWEKYVVQDKSVAAVGINNYAGEEGWYVPTYVIKGDAERGIEPSCPGLPNWEALNECVDVFKTARTAPQGQYMTGAESWAPTFGDQPRIDNLGLDYKMVFAGSEASLFAELSRAYEQGRPWLGLMWRPNYMTFKYDMTRVEFPPYSDECWGSTYACQWPDTEITRIASPALKTSNPTLWKMLENYDINREQLGEMQLMVADEGMSTQEAARTWMAENPDVWTAWF